MTKINSPYLKNTCCLLFLSMLAISSAKASPELDATRPFKLNASQEDQLPNTRQELAPPPEMDSMGTNGPDQQNTLDPLPMPDINSTPLARTQAPADSVENWPPTQAMSPTQPLTASVNQTDTTVPQNDIPEYGVDWSSWIKRLEDHWYSNLNKLVLRSGLRFSTGAPARILFTCYPNGQISNVALKRSCGVPQYDQMQMDALLRSQPAPPFPQNTQRTSFTLLLGWESHPQGPGQSNYRQGGPATNYPLEMVKQWLNWH